MEKQEKYNFVNECMLIANDITTKPTEKRARFERLYLRVKSGNMLAGK